MSEPKPLGDVLRENKRTAGFMPPPGTSSAPQDQIVPTGPDLLERLEVEYKATKKIAAAFADLPDAESKGRVLDYLRSLLGAK